LGKAVAPCKLVEKEKRKVSLGSATFGGPAVAQKYKVHQNVPF